MIQLIDHKLLDEVSNEARNTQRRRKNRNFHVSDDAPAHRLLNAIEPGSYVAPHRHLAATKDETFIVLRGRFGLVLFDDAGNIVGAQLVEAGGEVCGVDIPHGTWHSVLSLMPGGVFFEAKAGPYLPFTSEEKATWAPAENAIGAEEYLERLLKLFPIATS
ncbi:MAG: WbuC family cupin fold metalloprotein [Georgfuchsia sp.]